MYMDITSYAHESFVVRLFKYFLGEGVSAFQIANRK